MDNTIGEPTMATMINNLPGFIYRCANDPQWTMIYISEGCQQITGYTPDDFIGNKTLAFNDIIHPDYQQHLWDTWQEVLEKKGVLEEEYSIITSNGEIRWVWERGRGIFSEEGELLFLEGFITDITDRKRTEDALKESENKYRKIFENIQDVFYQVDVEGVINEISPSIFKYSGYTREELIGKPAEEVYYNPKDRNLLMEKLGEKGEVVDYDVRLKTKDDQPKWASLNIHLVFDANGNPAGLEGSLRDVSQRKLVEEALKASEERLQSIFRVAPTGIGVVRDRILLDINQRICEMTGYFRDELIGNSARMLYPSQDEFEFVGREKYRQITEKNTGVVETQWQKKDGPVIDIILASTPLNPNELSDGISFTALDITQRNRAEQLQKALYNISNAVATTRDVEELVGKIQVELGTLVDTTNFYVALYDEQTGMLSTPFYRDEVDEISTWPATKSATGYVIKTQESLLARLEDWAPLYESGEVEDVGVPSMSWLGVPLFMDGKATGALVVQSYDNPDAYSQKDVEILEFISHQISLSIQRKKAEQDLLEAMGRAQESDTLKSAFLANMSHEIRTPMNAILGFTELLGQPDSTPEEQEKFTGIIRNAGKKLMRLIDDIIDISKLEARQIMIAPSGCNIYHLLTTTVASFSSMEMLKKKPEVTLQLTIPPPSSIPELETDPVRLQQILDNLVTNAIKFTDKGFIEIGVRPIELSQGRFLEFYVKDTGKGIPSEKINIVFERFRQVEGDKYRQGAGLGLSISKALVELLGGEMRVVSEFGKGTTFYFTIPFRAVHNANTTTTQASSAKSLDLSGKTIYVAEDEDDGYAYISLLLKDTHAIIRRADNGDLLMNMIHEKIPHLILLDINMPGKTGYDCLKEIREVGYPIKIIAQTAYAMVEEKIKCMEAGCDGYLAKPFTKKGLHESIVNVLKAN
ncbi:MAG: PAS domain S-box protein [Bacteroidales bacterium]|nr:PAS domain S-box protein [Bacteroidales bacterium]